MNKYVSINILYSCSLQGRELKKVQLLCLILNHVSFKHSHFSCTTYSTSRLDTEGRRKYKVVQVCRIIPVLKKYPYATEALGTMSWLHKLKEAFSLQDLKQKQAPNAQIPSKIHKVLLRMLLTAAIYKGMLPNTKALRICGWRENSIFKIGTYYLHYYL